MAEEAGPCTPRAALVCWFVCSSESFPQLPGLGLGLGEERAEGHTAMGSLSAGPWPSPSHSAECVGA